MVNEVNFNYRVSSGVVILQCFVEVMTFVCDSIDNAIWISCRNATEYIYNHKHKDAAEIMIHFIKKKND